MLSRVSNYINNNNLFNKNEKIVLAVSGGVDSLVLLDILIKLGYQIIIAHINHKKRIESESEEKYLVNLALKLGLNIEVASFNYNLKENFHHEAHKFRYDFFVKVAKKYQTNIICTAHHLNDNLETVLLNMLSGSNMYGYSGINPKTYFAGFYITRPLMSITKDEILTYAEEYKILYFEDSSNMLDDYKRNKIRHHVIPSLTDIDDISKIENYSTILREAFNYIRGISIKYLNDNNGNILLTTFNKLDIALKKDIICLLLESKDIEKNFNLVNLILSLLNSDKSQGDITLKNDFLFKKRYQFAYIEKKYEHNKEEFFMNVNDIIYLDKYKLYFTKNLPLPNAKYLKLCYNSIAFPLCIRNRRQGDAINMVYGQKKLKNLFIDLKIPKELREKIIIITDSTSSILWVLDYAKSKEVLDFKDTGDIYLVCEINS